MIRAIALLHQHQRPIQAAKQIEYIEVTPGDIATANRLAHEILGRSLDELPAQTRRLLLLIDDMVSAQCRQLQIERSDFRFSRRDVRRHAQWGATQVRVHLDRLQEMEYVLAHRGARGQSFEYELLYQTGETHGYDLSLAASEDQVAGSKRPQNGGLAAGWRPHETRMNTGANGVFEQNREKRVSLGA